MLSPNHPLMYLVVFGVLFIVDIAWSFYINSVKNGSAAKAASWAAFMFGIQAVATISYVSNPLLLIPATIGGFLGTYVGVSLNSNKT